MQETIKKSLRLPADLVEYVEKADGDDFSKKMVNVLIESKEGEAKRQKEIMYYDRAIEKRCKELRDVDTKLSDAQRILLSLRHFFDVSLTVTRKMESKDDS